MSLMEWWSRLGVTVAITLIAAGCQGEIGAHLVLPPGAEATVGAPEGEGGVEPVDEGSGGGETGDGAGGAASGDPTNSGCVSDRIEVPAGESCTCTFDSCDATSLSCSCDLGCYDDPDCLINVGADGAATSGDGFLSDCELSCTPEDDLTTEITCSASSCEIVANTVEISPASAPGAPATATMTGDREVTTVDVVFVVDNSGSMVDNQMAAACAIDAFFDHADANGADYQTGVLTTDMLGDREAYGATYDKYTGAFVSAPELMSLAAPCDTIVACNGQCDATIDLDALCDFAGGGELVASDEPGAAETLRQLIVQGDNGSNYEGGLEQAFQFFAAQERDGTFDYDAPHEVVVISDEDADGDLAGDYQWLCPFYRPERLLDELPDFDPPAPGNTMASCQQDLIDFYVAYFTSRQIVVHGLLYTRDCASGSTEASGAIYLAVIAATGGVADSICHCDSFTDFFTGVGQSTSTLSTEMCFPGSLPDPATITVTYVATGELVPRSATDGWTLDAALNCIVMHGSWQTRYGSFRVDYLDPDAPPPPPSAPSACLAPGVDPLLETLRVLCGGVEVPQSSANGFTFDPVSDCFTFHGSWVAVDGATCVVEYL